MKESQRHWADKHTDIRKLLSLFTQNLSINTIFFASYAAVKCPDISLQISTLLPLTWIENCSIVPSKIPACRS